MPTILDTLITRFGFEFNDRDLRNFQRGIDQTRQRLNNLARPIAIVGATLTGVGFVVGRTVLSFDKAMNALRATFLDVPVEEVNKLREQALALGRTTSKSASDAANAQVELARSGLSVQQVYEAIPHVLNLAIAGELEMGEAAGLVTNQMAAFKLETTETERVVDVLARTAISAKTTVGELGPAFRQVAPLAAGLGIEIEQVGAFLGTLRTGGLIAEQAGTSLRNIISILQEDPTDKVRAGFQKLGLDFEEIRAMVSAGDLEGAFKRMGDVGLDTQTALQIFGRESAVAAALLAGSATDLDDFIARLKAAGGTAEDMRAIMESGLPGSTDEFKSALEGLQLALGDSGLRGAMIRILDTLKSFLSVLSNAPGPIRAFISAIVISGPILIGLAASLRILSWLLGQRLTNAILARAIPALSTLWLRLQLAGLSAITFAQRVGVAALATLRFAGRAIVAGIAGVITFAATIWAGAVPALAAFTAGVWASTVALLANPIGLIVIAIVALIAALVAAGFAIFKFRDQILDALKTAFNWIKSNWPLLLGMLLGPFGIAAALIFKFRDDVVGAFVWIKDQVMAAWEAMVQFILDKFDQVKDLPGQLLDAIPGGGAIKKASNWFFGQEGGVVPGPIGQPVPAIVHGGEWVLPTDVTRFLEGLGGRTPLPVANVPIGYPNFPLAPSAGTRTIVNHTTVNLDNITVHVERGDADEIATSVGEVLRRELQNTVDDFDSTIAR